MGYRRYQYTVYVRPSSHNGRCAKICWHSWSWPISFCLDVFLIITNCCKRFCTKHVRIVMKCHVVMWYVVMDVHLVWWFGCWFYVLPVPPSLKPSRWAFGIFVPSCEQWRWQQVSGILSTFILSFSLNRHGMTWHYDTYNMSCFE